MSDEKLDRALPNVNESEKSDNDENTQETSEGDQSQQVPGFFSNTIEHEVAISPNHLRYKTKHFNRFSDAESKDIVASEEATALQENKNIITNIKFDVYLNDSTRMPNTNYRHIEIQSKVNRLGELESSNIRHQIGEPVGDKANESPSRVVIESNGKVTEHILDSPQYLIETEFNREQKFNTIDREPDEQELEEIRSELIVPRLDKDSGYKLERRDFSLSRLLAIASLVTIIFSLICYIVLPFVVSPDDCKFSNDILFINQKPIHSDKPLAF